MLSVCHPGFNLVLFCMEVDSELRPLMKCYVGWDIDIGIMLYVSCNNQCLNEDLYLSID